MKCPRCQHENQRGAKFCEECATRLARACANCGEQLPPTAKFCPECAHPTGLSSAPHPPQRFGSPESYTPKHLAEKILSSKAALEGERKQVTVLFADLKGSMELLADRDPEEARKLIDPVLEQMMEAVHRYEGTVNQVMGDGIMALFGAPLAHEDHAVRACYAALRMQESVKQYAEDVRRIAGVPLYIRVGVNSGEVVVRSIGSDLRMDYTAVGQTTHLAARMEQIAAPGSVVVASATLALAEGCVEVKSLGSVPVKGLVDAVKIYEVIGPGLAQTRLQAAARRGLSRFVGRAAELEHLRRSQRLASEGHGQVAAIVGEPGVGKSRLVHEFTHSYRLPGWLVIEGTSTSYSKTKSYLPIINLLRSYFEIHGRDDLRGIREKVTGKLFRLDESLTPILPALLALLDVPVEDAAWRTLDPAQRRERTLDAVKWLIVREARDQPVLVIFEDLHWIDGETRAVLDRLVESLPSARVLLIVSYRPEYQHGWWGKTYYAQLRLDPLPPADADEFLDGLLGTDATVKPLKPVLIARTGGNPFFLEESARMLFETSALRGERGAYRLTGPVAAIGVPATVQAILASRIDRLRLQGKELLQTAAVIGRVVPLALLRATAELTEEDLRNELARLQSAEFLYEKSLFPDLEYTFKHALTHEVVYESLTQHRRSRLHARVVEVIERLHTDRLAEHVERLAHHAFRGELWAKAITYAREAAINANARSANHEAVGLISQALAALKCVPSHPGATESEIDLRLELRSALQALGALNEVLDNLVTAESLALKLGDQHRIGRVLAYLTDYFRLIGNQVRALETGRRAVAIADALGNPSLIVAAHTLLGQVFHARG
jgi:class 3 adenylate cyclase